MGKLISVAKPANYLDGCKALPDVTFIVQSVKVPAHRQILSEKSDYFRAMFDGRFSEAKSDEIVLKGTKLIPFTRVLYYIYTNSLGYLYEGMIRLPEIFDILKCAQYYMVDDLESRLISKLKYSCDHKDRLIVLLLQNALDYQVDELVLFCADFILITDYGYSDSPRLFDELTPTAVEYFLQLRPCASESRILEDLVYWMRQNTESKATFPELLKHIELHLLDNEHFSMLFEPTRLVTRRFFENQLHQQREQAKMVHKVVNQNVVDGVRVVEGKEIPSENVLKPLKRDENYITVDLKKRFLLNCIKLKLFYHNSYTLSISQDMRDWERVIDHSKYKCSGQQVLYFPERVVRFTRIECKASNWAIDANIEAIYATDLPELDQATPVCCDFGSRVDQ
uniref:BTB domain-containing protein n=1 Tax=Panagrellus redivivus TaxID=6233 RepID=A0A7E4W8P7_PANRE